MCVYKSDDGICKKYSTDGVTSYCVDGPCTEEVLSNADRIRSMTDEELRDFLYDYKFTEMCVEGCEKCVYGGRCEDRLLDWLKRPAKEE